MIYIYTYKYIYIYIHTHIQRSTNFCHLTQMLDICNRANITSSQYR